MNKPPLNRVRFFLFALLSLIILIPLSRIFISHGYWISAASLPEPNMNGELVALANGGALLISGNSSGKLNDLRACWVFDSHANRWSSAPPVPLLTEGWHALILLPDGRLFGMCRNGKYEIYTPATNSWSEGKLLLPHTNPLAQVTPDGHLKLVNGFGVEIVDPTTRTSTFVRSPHPTGFVNERGAALSRNRGIFFMSGKITLFDFDTTASHQSSATYPNSGMVHPIALASGRIFCAFENNPVSEGVYDPDADTYTSITDPDATFGQSVTPLPDGKVLLIGGMSRTVSLSMMDRILIGFRLLSYTGMSPSVRIYDPVSGRFTRCVQLQHPRSFHTTVVLSDNRVLVCGGRTDVFNRSGGNGGSTSCEIISLKDLDP